MACVGQSSAPLQDRAHVDFLPPQLDTHLPREGDNDPDADIYRGGPSSPPRTPRPPSASSAASTSSSSSSGSFVFGGRLGAISQLVEHAISHWARAWASSSSLATSSSSSASTDSITTKARSKSSRRRRSRHSLADHAKSEREVAARIRAREQSRQVPREFTLYTPPGEGVAKARIDEAHASVSESKKDGVLRTTSLPLVITRLSVALKDNQKSHRAREIAHMTPSASEPNFVEQSAMSTPILEYDHVPTVSTTTASPRVHSADDLLCRKDRKGKHRIGKAGLIPSTHSIPKVISEQDLDRAWWLDLSSPTPQDMRAIGKLLQIHPLTLEDILTQDPREKLEIFPSLGYYFVAFRAIESQKTRERIRLRMYNTEGQGIFDEGIVGIVNVYLVVFREGICSFHFSDIADHTDAVRNRVLTLDDPMTMSSDWIAHGIMDSIVDSFFPFLEEIEKEVIAIEALVFSNVATGQRADQMYSTESTSDSITVVSQSQGSLQAEKADDLVVKREDTGQSAGAKAHFSLPQPPRPTPRVLRKYFRALKDAMRLHTRTKGSTPSQATSTVHRMAKSRRLVTSLTRVLTAKSEVVAQLKKRLLKTGGDGAGDGRGGDRDVFMYMGDIQDHILTLQQSLAHYERMLSQSYPTYLTELRLTASKAKSSSDKSVVFLSVVSMGVLCIQTLIGLFSMNVHVPMNVKPGGTYHLFGIVLVLAFLISVVYGIFVRSWWIKAERKRNW